MSFYTFNQFSPSDYTKTVRGHIIYPRFRLTWLYPDERAKEDITEYMQLDSGSLGVNYNQGQRRSLNFTLNNTNGRFTPNLANNGLWINTKFKFELGVELDNGDVIFSSAGVFVLSNPSALRQNAQKTIDVQCVDKFALLDGTLGGTLETTYEIPSGSNIKEVVQNTLLLDNGNGYPIDIQPLVFDSLYANATTQYTITKSPNESLGDMLIELANMIGCDVWYGVDGNLIFRSGTRDITHITKPTLWHYKDTELEYVSNSTTYDFTKVRNSVTVVGANVNGDKIYVGVAENVNPKSSTRVGVIGRKIKYVEDSNIYNEELAQQRAEYELNKVSILQNTISLQSTYMIHLDVNNCIAIDDDFFKYFDTRFVIQSLNIPLSINSVIDIQCTNIAELPYYPD